MYSNMLNHVYFENALEYTVYCIMYYMHFRLHASTYLYVILSSISFIIPFIMSLIHSFIQRQADIHTYIISLMFQDFSPNSIEAPFHQELSPLEASMSSYAQLSAPTSQ